MKAASMETTLSSLSQLAISRSNPVELIRNNKLCFASRWQVRGMSKLRGPSLAAMHRTVSQGELRSALFTPALPGQCLRT
nr:hypothetical protein CFP56_16728 [Quercus suber]